MSVLSRKNTPLKDITFGIISDTHSFLDPALEVHFAGVDHILHAGDIGSPSVLDTLNSWAPTLAVKGNIDGGDLHFLPLEIDEVFAGKRIVVRHIAGNPFRPNARARRILETVPDVLIVGHSHIPVFRRVGTTLWINPGAAGRHGFHQERCAAFLHIRGGEISIERILLGPRYV